MLSMCSYHFIHKPINWDIILYVSCGRRQPATWKCVLLLLHSRCLRVFGVDGEALLEMKVLFLCKTAWKVYVGGDVVKKWCQRTFQSDLACALVSWWSLSSHQAVITDLNWGPSICNPLLPWRPPGNNLQGLLGIRIILVVAVVVDLLRDRSPLVPQHRIHSESIVDLVHRIHHFQGERLVCHDYGRFSQSCNLTPYTHSADRTIPM